MLKSLGKVFNNAVTKAAAISAHSGKPLVNPNQKFSLTNPDILETLADIPDSLLKKLLEELSIFEGKKLSTVCRVLDSPDYLKILNRYKKLSASASRGFNQDEIKQLINKACIRGKHGLNSNLDAMVYMGGLDGSIAQHFDAHGIAKGSLSEQLEQLNNILSNGIDKTRSFCTAPLGVSAELRKSLGSALGTAGGCAYRDGSFILVSGQNKSLINDGIKHVIVNDAYYGIIDDLISRFPNINFIKAENAAEYFNKYNLMY